MSRFWGKWLLPFILLTGLGALAVFLGLPRQNNQVEARVIGLPAGGAGDFARVEGPRELVFPRDHGAHPDYQTEWWYYTGNLAADNGRRFGFQLTFFRRAVLPVAERVERESAWATEQVYMAHFTLTDVGGQKFQAFERLERGAGGLAGAQGDPFYQVWLRDWSVEQVSPDRYHLRASEEGVDLDLMLTDRKGPVLQGNQGYSQKGPEEGNASIYFSQTRLEAEGTVRVGIYQYPVIGFSWMDHEYSTSALSAGQVGWDWFSIQMDDGSELMMFHIRRADGSVDPFSSGTWIAPDGSTQKLSRDDFQIEVLDTWTSPRSGGEYPSGWQVSIPALDLNLRIEPLLQDQELDVSYRYWEGAVEILGEREGRSLTGYGYVELTGYARSMEGEF